MPDISARSSGRARCESAEHAERANVALGQQIIPATNGVHTSALVGNRMPSGMTP
jgi:hypothetical protein